MADGDKPRALGLVSGGLDSLLAALVLRRAGVEVSALTFTSPFFGAREAKKGAAAIDMPLTVLEIGPEHLELVVKNPRYGYGSNMNPCIDCHAYMIKRAGEIIASLGMDFVFTGEVLGQRPMSQNRQALNTVANASGMKKLLLRPLCAERLDPTPMEQSGLVDRDLLLGMSGRSRKPQMALAEELGLKEYPAPAGGCLLTEPGFSRRLSDLLKHTPECTVAEVELLKHGRHFRLGESAKLAVGRNQGDNQRLEKAAPPGSLQLITQGVPGPLGVYQGPPAGPMLELAAAVVAGYSKAPEGQLALVAAGAETTLKVMPLSRRQVHGMLL